MGGWGSRVLNFRWSFGFICSHCILGSLEHYICLFWRKIQVNFLNDHHNHHTKKWWVWIIYWQFIPDICHFFYTSTFQGLKILHSKVRKFVTKTVSRQNSVNLYFGVKIHTVCKITHLVYVCMKLKIACKNIHCV